MQPRMTGRVESPCSSARTTSCPISFAVNGMMLRAGTGSQDLLSAKVTIGSLAALKPASRPNTTPPGRVVEPGDSATGGCVLIDSMLRRYSSLPISADEFIARLVLQNLLPLHRDVFGCLLIDLTRTLDGDVLAFDLNRAVFFHMNARFA